MELSVDQTQGDVNFTLDGEIDELGAVGNVIRVE
jgi:hypothetical protein